MSTQQILEDIQKEFLKSFLFISNAMTKLFDKSILEKLKESEKSLISSSEASGSDINNNQLLEKINKKNKEKKVAFDLFSGKNAETLFINRIDRDVFELKYHKNFKLNEEYNFSKLNEDIPNNQDELNELTKYLNESKDIFNFFCIKKFL